MAAALVILLAPMFIRGAGAVFFTATVEHRRMMLEKFERGNPGRGRGRNPGRRRGARAGLADWRSSRGSSTRRRGAAPAATAQAPARIAEGTAGFLLGPRRANPGRCSCGTSTASRGGIGAQVELAQVLKREEWDYSNPAGAACAC